MATSKVRNYLQELCAYLPNEGNVPTGTKGDEKAIAQDIAIVITSEVAEADLDYVCSLLFQSNQSLLVYLRGNINNKDNMSASAVALLLGFLVSFFVKAQEMIQPYAISIKNCLVKLAANGSAKVRAAALEALSTLLDNDRTKIDVSEFNIQDMFTQFTRDFSLPVSKTPASVKGSILEILGVIIRYHYKTIKQGDIAQVVRWSFITLREQLFTSKTAENAVLRGILGGLDHLLSCKIVQLDTGQLDLLYKSVRTLFDIPEGLSRYEAPLAALTLFSNHVATFGKYIVQDSQVLYKDLNRLCGSQNRNISSMGYRSMDKFLKEVSEQLAAKQPGKQERRSFEFLMDIFIHTLRQKIDEISFRELSVAIRGIGYFSRAFDKFLTTEEIDVLREYLVKISSWFYSEYDTDQKQMAAHLPAFIQAYTYFAASQTDITPTFMSTIVKLINVFVYSYIRLNTITRSTGLFAIRELLQVLYYKGEGTLRSFLSAFLYETLIATCTDDQSGSYEGQESYIEFLYFWEKLLNTRAQRHGSRKQQKHQKGQQEESKTTAGSDSETDIESDSEMDVDDDDYGGGENEESLMDLQAILFDEFLTAFLRLLKNFNLDLTKKEDEDDTASATSEDSASSENAAIEGIATPNMLQPVNEQHFVIFQNAVEFWCMLLPKLYTHRLKDWTYLAASAMIDLSLRRPLVSGFYKMLAAMLSVAHKRKLFKGYKELHAAQQQRKQLGAICDISETQTDMFSAFVIFRDFLKEVWHRLQQFKDELLASCLRAILAYPLAFFDVHELVHPIRTAFRLGLTVYSLSDTALDVLYELTDPDAPNQDLNSFFGDILPSMNEYLLMALGSKEDKDRPNTGAMKKWKPTTRAQRKQETFHYKPEQEALGTVQAENVTSLRDVQLRVVRFLGRIGGANKLMLKDKKSNQTRNDDSKDSFTSVHESRQQLLAWDPDRQLKIRLPFPNANIDVTMDEMLPRICELAESSPDRQVKVAACELLHGLILSMIGDSAFQARDSKEAVQSRYHRVYIRVFPILLRLAIDVETIARDMFSTLVRQLIHWFTNNAQYENPETVALLQACIDAACSTDAGLRDYGADCIQEFALWSIRQQGASRARENSPMNIKSLLKRVYNLASNPSSRQRLGACIIFNRIYRTFREEETLVNEFTLELLYWIFFSLKLAEDDHPLIGTLDQAKEAITHIKRIIRKKVALFNTANKNRRRFPGIEEDAKLAAIVGWAFDQTAQTQREYARECMKFFEEFVGHITGVKSDKQWLSKRLREKKGMLQDRFETDRIRPQNINSKNGLSWLRQLRSALDGYFWLVDRKMVTLPFLLDLEPSSWTEACVYLLDHSPEDIFGRQSSIEKTRAEALYAYAYYQLVALITEAGSTGNDPQSKEPVVDDSQAESVLEALVARGIITHENYVAMVVQLLLLPNQFVEAAKAEQGSIANRLSDEKIRQLVRKFLRLMAEHGSGKFMRMFNKACSTVLYSRNVDLTNLQLNQSALNDMLQIADGIKILQDLSMFDDVCKAASESSGGATSAHDYCAALLDKFVQYSSTTEPVWIELVGEILKIAFHQPGFAAKYASQLLLENSSTYADRLATYQRFNAYINDCIAMNFKDFAPVLISHANDRFIHEVVIGVVTYLRTERSAHKREVAQFVDQLLYETTFLTDIIKAWGNDSNMEDLVKFLTGLLGADPGIPIRTKGQPIFSTLCEALQVCLAPEVPLAIKIEAFELIPVFITVSGDHIDKIAKAVDHTVRRQLNYRSTDLDPSTTVYREYVAGLEKLLKIMSQFSALWMFEILFPVFIQEDNHTHNDIIQTHISKYAKRLGPTDFEKTVSICLNFYKDENQRMDWRRAAINLIISLHALVPEGHVVTFYIDNIQYIMNIVLRQPLRRGSDQEVIDDMEERMCCFRLIQTMYEKLPAVDVHTKTSKIVEAYMGEPLDEKSGRKMMKDLITHLEPVVKEKEAPSSNPSINETRLHYHRVAYNALTAAIMRTQKSAAVFSGYLMHSTAQKPLWENIVDITDKISLPASLDKRMEQERLVEYKRKSEEREKEEQEASVKYMASIQTTTDSLTQASLTDMALASLGFSAESTDNGVTEGEPHENSLFEDDEEQVTIDRSRGKDMIEKDQISSNPCMKSVLVTIRRLHKITPMKEDKTMPDWMRNFSRAFTAQDAPLQVRLFIAKAMVLEPDAFEPYAEYWIRPLMRLAIEGDQYGDPLNYMAVDISTMVVIWGLNNKMRDTYEDRYLLYEFVNYFIKHGYNKNLHVQKQVVNILKGAFENWKQQIIVPTHTIYTEISTPREVRGDELGLQYVGIALAHDMDPFYDGPEVKLEGLTEEAFYKGISTNLWNAYAEVYRSAAEILGWSLELKKKRGKSTEYLEKVIDACINRMDPFGKKNTYTSDARFLRCIQRIQIHDREIIKKYMNKVLFLIPQLYGDLKIDALRIIAGGSEDIPDLFKSIQSKKLLKTLTRGDAQGQIILLTTLEKIAGTLTLPQIDHAVDTISDNFVKHPNVECRRLFYKFIQSVNDVVKAANDQVLGDKIKVLVLQGMADSDNNIRNTATSYIKTSYGIQDDIYSRLKAVMGDMYMPEIEHQYLLYSTEMILDTTKQGDDYDTAIFKDPLPNARFDAGYTKIDTSWQLRNPMTPLFVATQDQSLNSQDYLGGVRATQTTFQFSLTQSAATQGPSLASTFSSSVFANSMDVDTPTAAADESQQATNDYRSAVGRSPRKKNKLDKYQKFNQRAYNPSQNEEALHFSDMHDRRRKRARIAEQLRKQAREKKVQMIRDYRMGDLPDVQIKHHELVLPLQVLGRSDNDIARMLYAALASTIANHAERLRGKTGYRDEIAQIANENLEKSKMYFPPAIGSFLRINYEIPITGISTAVVNTCSQRSFNQNIAIALIERQFLYHVEDKPKQPSKRARTTKTPKLGQDKKQWIDLAQLYKSIDQPEIFQNLYQAHVASVSISKEAIDAEIQGHYARAANLFVEVYDNYKDDVDPEEHNLWMQELLNCYEQLTEWQDMAASVRDKFSNNFEAIWDDPEKDEYLKYFMRSYTKLRQGLIDNDGEFTPWTDERPNPVLDFVASAAKVPERMQYLLHHAACDVSQNAIWKSEYDRARYYTRESYDSLLSIWTSLHPLAYGSRMAQLAVLERTVELEEFLDIVSDLQRSNAGRDKVERYMRGLLKKFPDNRLDGMDVWDDIIDARNLFLDELEGMQADLKERIPDQNAFSECKKSLLKSMISAARQQNNVNVASTRFKQLDSFGISKEEKTVMQLENRLLLIPTLENDAQVGAIARMMNIVIKNEGPMTRSQYKNDFLLAAANTFECAKTKLQGDPDETFSALMSSSLLVNLLSKHKFKNATMLANYLNSTACQYLQDVYVATMDADPSAHLACLWKLAEYCDNALAANEEESCKVKIKIDTEMYSRIVINNYFRAMELGKKEAIERFPRLLELIERYPENGPEFKSKAESFGPTWMYIRWIPQMVAIMDNPIAGNVFPALLHLALSYPNAIYYAFNISNEHFKAIGDKLDETTRNYITKLEDVLYSSMREKFITELRRLTNPEHIVKDFAGFLETALYSDDISKEFVLNAYNEFNDLVMNSRSSEMGEIPKDFAVLNASYLRDCFGTQGSKLFKITRNQIQDLRVFAEKKARKSKKKPDQLGSFSPFLAEFQGTEWEENIEIPGQYSGFKQPHPEDHAKVASFDERLLVMSSMRAPKRLRIYGTDEKKHDFLVKGGEDLRLDQRLQQLFTVMNEILQEDQYCARHNVNIRTYKVIPMSTTVGMIEWVADTIPLQSCLDAIDSTAVKRTKNSYNEYINKYRPRGALYGFQYTYSADRDKIVENYESSASLARPDMLRNYFLRLAASPEAFLYIRDDFVHSLAAVSISGYVLGIGDRHLENFLVDLNSGQLVPIDFGYAFGAATELLPIPELMPFRLTKQLTGVCEPVGVSGMLETPMIHILQALQDKKGTLLNTMDVFIKEPLLDWRKEALFEIQRQKQRSGLPDDGGKPGRSGRAGTASASNPGASSTTTTTAAGGSPAGPTPDQEIAWYPQQKLDTARNKLSLENPGYTIAKGVSRNKRVVKWQKDMVAVARGDPKYNIRARVGERCSTVQEQVRCLIDLATDPAILGRTWAGWSPLT